MRSICALHEEEQYVHWIMNKEKSTQQMALHEANICTNKNIVCWVYVIEYTPQPKWMCAGTGYCWYADCRRLLVVLLFRTLARSHSFILLYREKNTLLLNNSFLYPQNTNSPRRTCLHKLFTSPHYTKYGHTLVRSASPTHLSISSISILFIPLSWAQFV